MGHILSQKPCWTFALLGWAELLDFISKQVPQYELNSTFANLASTLRPLPIPLSIRVTYCLKYILIIFMSLQMNGNIVTQLFINGLFFGRTAQSIFKCTNCIKFHKFRQLWWLENWIFERVDQLKRLLAFLTTLQLIDILIVSFSNK